MKSKNVIEDELERTLAMGKELYPSIYNIYLRGVVDALRWALDKESTKIINVNMVALSILNFERWAQTEFRK